jgi:hypothetical protein
MPSTIGRMDRSGAGYSFTSFPPVTIGRRGRFSHREVANNLLYGVVHAGRRLAHIGRWIQAPQGVDA